VQQTDHVAGFSHPTQRSSDIGAIMLQDIASFATAIGVIATAIGIFYTRSWLKHSQHQAVMTFEDELNREYRQLIRGISTNALLAKPLTDIEYRGSFRALYHYLDLSNEQVFLRQQGRVSSFVWASWSDGISSHLSRPAFKKAWEEVKDNSRNFTELRWLEKTNFKKDPYGVPLEEMQKLIAQVSGRAEARQ
jgi:hypothetical protein